MRTKPFAIPICCHDKMKKVLDQARVAGVVIDRTDEGANSIFIGNCLCFNRKESSENWGYGSETWMRDNGYDILTTDAEIEAAFKEEPEPEWEYETEILGEKWRAKRGEITHDCKGRNTTGHIFGDIETLAKFRRLSDIADPQPAPATAPFDATGWSSLCAGDYVRKGSVHGIYLKLNKEGFLGSSQVPLLIAFLRENFPAGIPAAKLSKHDQDTIRFCLNDLDRTMVQLSKLVETK